MLHRKLFALAVPLSLAIGLVVAPAAQAAQSQAEVDAVASRAKLEAIIAPQVHSTYNTIEGTVSSLVASTVRGMIGNPTAIKNLVTPLLSAAVKAKLAEYNISHAKIDELIDTAVDQAVNNQIVDAVLSNEFVQAVLNRAIDYAVADIVAQLGVSADEAQVTASIVDHIWNASLRSVGTASTKVKGDIAPVCAAGGCVNGSYHNFDVVAWNSLFGIKTTPKEIKVTGWNTTTVNTYVSGATVVQAGSKLNQYQAALATMDYQQIITQAIKRAAIDEVTERVNAFVLKVKTEAVNRITAELAKIGVTVQLNPADSPEVWAQQLADAFVLKAKTDSIELITAELAKIGVTVQLNLDDSPEIWGQQVVTALQAAGESQLQALRASLVTLLTAELAKIGVAVQLNPTDSPEVWGQQIVAAFQAAGLNQLQALLDSLHQRFGF